jgi:ABC-2 type transport system ATP-binding protein
VREAVAARRISSVLFQEPVIDRALTGRQQLQLHTRLWNVPAETAKRRIADACALFGLGDIIDRPAGGYSGGERRRLEFARALTSQPLVLFLDEPSVGLDPRIRFELLDVLAELRARGEITILLTTHYLDEAERLCDRIAIMHAGRIVALDSPAALLAQLGGEIAELRIRGDAHAALAALRARGIAGDDVLALGSTLTLPLHTVTPAEAIGVIDELAIASSVGFRPPTLDDVYLRFTGDRIAA